jgi:putative hydrolase of the HAD superfamily
MRIKAVAFDIDGTLYSSIAFYLGMFDFAFRRWGVLRSFSAVRKEIHRESADPAARGRAGQRDLAAFRGMQARLFAARSGLSAEKAAEILDRVMYGELDGYFRRARLYPGLLECLDSLQAAGLRLAVLSDFPPLRKLEILGLKDRFEVARATEESGFLKPAPEPFLALAAELGLAPAEVLFVGNHPIYDIQGAAGAGMPAALRGHSPAPRASLHFKDWSKLTRFALDLAKEE